LRNIAKGRSLTLRALHHGCVVQLARAGCTIPEIAAITGHSPASVAQILAVYLPRDNQVAWNAQVNRGLIIGNDSGTGVQRAVYRSV
jgi:integrase